jgi:ATP-binding cassette subfamily C protein CydC
MTAGIRDLKPVLALFWRGPRRKLLFGLLLSGTTIASGLALLGLSGWFITASSLAGLSAATALAFDVFSPAAGIRFFALARTASRYGERLVTHDAALSVIAELRERLFRGSASLREAEKLRTRPASLLFRLTQDIDALDSLYLRVLVPMFGALAAAASLGIAFGLIQPLAGLAVAILVVAFGIGIPAVYGRMAVVPQRRRALMIEALRSRVIDLVSGHTELAMIGQLGAQRRAIIDAEVALSQADDDLNRIETAAGIAFGFASAALMATALFAASQFADHGRIGAPFATLVVLIAIAGLEPFSALRRGALELGRTILAARRISPRLGLNTPSIVEMPQDDLACSLENVSIRHASAPYPLVRHFSFSLPRGERCALIGPSGSGKSTLLFSIAGELSPQAGRLTCLPATLFTQRTELFADTLGGNLRLADPQADDARLSWAIETAGLGPYLRALPEGLDTRLGEGGMGLSGGEGRRLALARLFLRDTPLWLLDEPTEGLDDATARDVIARLIANAQSRTLLIATHIRREAEIADRLLAIDGGHIVECARRGDAQFDIMLSKLRHD